MPPKNIFVMEKSLSCPAVWSPDLGDGTYRNPILYADYSDPDVVRSGDDYWMISSSFSHVPGLPVLHSRDLVNWTLVTHALPRLVPEENFRTPQHGKGVWAPSIRHHAGKFWIYYPDPDFGIYLLTATDARGPWSAPHLVKSGKGLIDPCPLWDDDGRVFLIHGWAKSRAGINNVLTLLRLSADGLHVAEDLGVIINGNHVDSPGFRTLEGPKLYRRNGWYYVFAPAGGVAEGWQSVFRSRKISGPYEHRIVLGQGATPVNGPHQGALVDTDAGEWWFFHFQDKGAYGRIVHLQPVRWENDWPLMGTAVENGTAKGEPVLVHRKPALPLQRSAAPGTSDEFDSPVLGLQWQWQANPQASWYSLSAAPGSLRLFGQARPDNNLYHAPNLLLQKFAGEEFCVTTVMSFNAEKKGDKAGLIVFGYDYAWIGLRHDGTTRLAVGVVKNANVNPDIVETVIGKDIGPSVHLRVEVRAGGRCRFAYSGDGENFLPVGDEFKASVGHWVGAKFGLFASSPNGAHADFDWVRVEPPLETGSTAL